MRDLVGAVLVVAYVAAIVATVVALIELGRRLMTRHSRPVTPLLALVAAM